MLRSLLALVRAQLTEILRSRTALFWSLAFPLGFLFLFGGIMARGNPRAATYMMPGLLTTMLLSGSLFGIAFPMVQAREVGILRRLRVTPLRATTVVLAHGITAVIQNALTFAMLLVVGRLVFKTEVAGSLMALGAVFLCGAFAMVPLGLLAGSAARDLRTAPAILNLLFFPLMFLSGSAFPFGFLPDGVKTFARLLPTTYLLEGLQSVVVRGEPLSALVGTLAVLLALGVVGIALDAMLFRWEGTEPISRKAMATIAAAFAVVLVSAALLAPAFRMSAAPGTRRVEAGEAKGQVLVLRGATVLDGLGGRIERARVVIRDHRIDDVGLDETDRPLPEGATVEDLGGRFLIPGLFDSHVHLGGSGGVGAGLVEQSAERAVHDLQAYLASGVTAVVSLTDDADDLLRLRGLVAAGKMRAPRVFLSGPSVTAPHGHPAKMFEFMPGLAETLTRQVQTEDEARAAVAGLSRRDVDIVKLVLEPGFPGRPMPRLEDRVFKAALGEARARGMRVTVHAGTDEDARAAIEAGADGIEHAPRGLTDDTIALMAARKVVFTPTLTVFDIDWKRQLLSGDDARVKRLVLPEVLEGLSGPESFFQKMGEDPRIFAGMRMGFEHGLQSVGKAARAGVRIVAGTDAGNPATFHGHSLAHELELLARAGVPLGEVLQSATSRAADRLGQRELGRVAKGAIADLTLLGGDPQADAAAYRDVRAVFLGGRRLDPERLFGTPAGPWRPGQ